MEQTNNNLQNVEVYFFWLDFFGYTCNVSDNIMQQTIKEVLPQVKYQVVDLDKQPSSDFIVDTNYREKIVLITNKQTGYTKRSSIRELIAYETPVNEIIENFVNEIKQVASK